MHGCMDVFIAFLRALNPRKLAKYCEIDWCLKRLVTLQQEWGADLRIRTPWGSIHQLPIIVAAIKPKKELLILSSSIFISMILPQL